MKRDSLKRTGLALILVAPVALGACGRDDGNDFRDGVPYQEDVALAFPGAAAPAATGALVAAGGATVVRAALLGDQSEFYQLTRAITVSVNSGTAAVLALVKAITDYPPTSVAADVAVWGPYTAPLSANTWRLTVNRDPTAKGQFQYVFEAKPRIAGDTAYVTVLSGHHVVANPAVHRAANAPSYGHGDFVLDWDAAATLPEHDANVGKGSFTYTRETPTSEVGITVLFTNVMDNDTGMLIDASYAYTETPGMGGTFQFSQDKDIVTTTAALETLTVRSRWLETGAGRSDVKIAGGDLGTAEATLNECWGTGDTGFLSVFETNSFGDATKMWGAETACAFTPAMYTAN
jgi:hypothetical protein